MDYLDELKAVPARELEPGDTIVNFKGEVTAVHETGTKAVYVEFDGDSNRVYGVIWDGGQEIVRRVRPNETEGA